MTATTINGNRFIIKFSQFDDEITNLGDSTAKLYYSITTDNIQIKWIDLKHEFDKTLLSVEIFNKYFDLYFDTFKRSVMSFFECCYVDEEQTIVGLCLKSKFKKPDHPDHPSAMLVCSSINSHVSLRPKIAVYPNGGYSGRLDCTLLNSGGAEPSFIAVDDQPNISSGISPLPHDESSIDCIRNNSVLPNNNASLDDGYYQDIEDQLNNNDDDDYEDEIFRKSDIFNEANSPIPCTSNNKPASVEPQPVSRAISAISLGCKRKANNDDESDDDGSSTQSDDVAAAVCNKTAPQPPTTFAPNSKRPKFYSVNNDVTTNRIFKKNDSSESSSSESEFGADGNDLDDYEEDPIFELQSEISLNEHDENQSITSTTYNRFGQFDLSSQIMSSTRRPPQQPSSDIGSSVVNNFNSFNVQTISSRASSTGSNINKIMHKSKIEKTHAVILSSIAGKIISNLDLSELDEIQFRDIYQYYSKDALDEKDLLKHKSIQNVNAQKLTHVFELYTEDSSSVFNTRMLILVIRQILIDRDANMRNFLLVGLQDDDATIK